MKAAVTSAEPAFVTWNPGMIALSRKSVPAVSSQTSTIRVTRYPARMG